jgi:hypothetical protein
VGVSGEFPLATDFPALLRVGHRPDGPPTLDKPPPDSFPGESRDPFIRLLSARRVGLGFPPGQRIYRILPLNHLVSF